MNIAANGYINLVKLRDNFHDSPIIYPDSSETLVMAKINFIISLTRSLCSRYRTFILYCAIGCTGAMLDFIVYSILTLYFNFYYIYANILGVLLGVTNNFFLNRNLNFQIKDHTPLRYLSFFSVGILGLILSVIALKVLVDTFHVQQQAAKIITIFFVVGMQFIFNSRITFRVGKILQTKTYKRRTSYMDHLTIVMPVYNEKEIIASVIDDWLHMLRSNNIDFDILVLDDGSTDGSREVLDVVADANLEVNVIHKANSGHGPTILSAYKMVCKRKDKEGDWIFQIDSDNELPATGFEKVWNLRHCASFVVGRRIGREQPLPRRIISLFSRLIVRVFYGRGIWDVNSPYRLMHTRDFECFITALPDDTFAPNVILTGCAAWAKIPSAQVDVPYKGRMTGCESLNRLKLLKAACLSMFQTIRFRFSLHTKLEDSRDSTS